MTFLCGAEPSPAAHHLRSLSEITGISSKWVSNLSAIRSPDARPSALVIDLVSVAKSLATLEVGTLKRVLSAFEAPVLVLATSSSAACNDLLKELTGCATILIESLDSASSLAFASEPAAFLGCLASTSLPRGDTPALVISESTGALCNTLMATGGRPSLVRLKAPKYERLVWAAAAVLDPDRPLTRELELEAAGDQFLPAIIFLRMAFSDHCWHSPRALASFIIDDPLLEERYGFVEFFNLLASARRNRYFINLAFIPWNHRRSDPRIVSKFIGWSDCFSICVHGCDHTRGEYAIRDYALLVGKNRRAIRRMRQHEQRTALAFEPVMVCPQEAYSYEAIRAFSDGVQFIAAANTSCIASGSTPEAVVRGRDLLGAVQDAYFGFPVLKRYYPHDPALLVLSVFLGKPLVLVEHQSFFKEGVGNIERLVSWATALCHPRWMSVGQIARTASMRRRLGERRFQIRIYADLFEDEDLPESHARYDVLRRAAPDAAIVAVCVNGSPVDFRCTGGDLSFSFSTREERSVRIAIERIPSQFDGRYPSASTYQVQVAVRRWLSEFRDKVLSRHAVALSAAKWVMQRMRQTTN